MRFLIIGGDAAGMSAASKAKRNNTDMAITVLEKTEDVSYSACGMPYNIADGNRPVESLIVRTAEEFRNKQGINVLTGHTVTAINKDNKSVSGINKAGALFEFSYDKLLIATGNSPVLPALPGFDLPGVVALKNLDDARKIKHYIDEKKVKHAVIIGMGYIGLEMCEALRTRNIQVDLIDITTDLLPWMKKELSDTVKAVVESHEVKLYTGQTVTHIKTNTTGLTVISKDNDFHTDMVLVAVGVKPNSELALNAGIKLGVNNTITVDRNLKTSDDNIYAAGDCADVYHIVTGKKTWLPLALRANRAGWAVADHICGKNAVMSGVVGTAIFRVFDLQVATTGLTEKEAEANGFDPVSVTIKTRSRAHGYPGSTDILVGMVGDKKTGKLLGAQMVGKEGVAHRINTVAIALHNDMSVELFCQADLAYAPPFGPVWDPLLTAANQLIKKM